MASRRIQHREYGRPLPAATRDLPRSVFPEPRAGTHARESNAAAAGRPKIGKLCGKVGREPADAARARAPLAFFPDCSEARGSLDLLTDYDLEDDYSCTDYGRRRYGRQREFEQESAPSGVARADERIRDEVCLNLRRTSSLDVSDISVAVIAGEVTLSGSIEDRGQKHQAEDLAAEVSGVIDVHNQLRLRRTRRAAAAGGSS
jgi:hypothetical protein